MRDQVLGAFRHLLGFITRGVDFDADRRHAFEIELQELIAPHMPVLVHRRMKLLEGSGQERWCDELDSFMRDSLWPLLGADRDFAERNRTFVTLIVDVAIERQQCVMAGERPLNVPLVSRFDTSWAS